MGQRGHALYAFYPRFVPAGLAVAAQKPIKSGEGSAEVAVLAVRPRRRGPSILRLVGPPAEATAGTMRPVVGHAAAGRAPRRASPVAAAALPRIAPGREGLAGRAVRPGRGAPALLPDRLGVGHQTPRFHSLWFHRFYSSWISQTLPCSLAIGSPDRAGQREHHDDDHDPDPHPCLHHCSVLAEPSAPFPPDTAS